MEKISSYWDENRSFYRQKFVKKFESNSNNQKSDGHTYTDLTDDNISYNSDWSEDNFFGESKFYSKSNKNKSKL